MCRPLKLPPTPWLLPLRRLAPAVAAALLLSLIGCDRRSSEGVVLRLATTQQGERMRGPFRQALRDFERERPGVRVELVEMDDDVYQKMGLLTQFVGGTPPDVYFQWGGYQVRKYAVEGLALDLSRELGDAERKRYLPFCWASCAGSDGRTYMWPTSASITTVFWYRVSLFSRLGLQPPRDWAELLRTCDALRAAGVIPLAIGNRELWPGGNLAAYMAAQQGGPERYSRVLGLAPGTRLDDPGFVAALTRLSELEAAGALNSGVAGVGTDEARSLLAQSRAAIHPIGDWLATEADASDVEDLDAFLLPRLPDQKGAPSTILGLSTGYMVYRRTRYPREAVDLLRHLASDSVQREWTRHGHLSPVRAAAPGPGSPRALSRVYGFMREAAVSVLAPDVGFNLEVSDAFLDAVSLVLGRRASPSDALAAAELQVRPLRREPPADGS